MNKRLHFEYDYYVSDCGKIFNLRNRRLSPKIDKNGYEIVGLSKNNKKKFFRVHRLIAEVFFDKFDKDLQINHINGIKNDNRIENLELVTSKQNHIHRVDVLKVGVGESHPNRKLTSEQVKNIRYDFANNKLTQKEL